MNDKKAKISAAVVAIVLVAIAAVVILYPHEIEVSWEGEGDVTPDEGSMRFYESMDLRIEPADGWTVGSVTVDGEAVELRDDTYSLKVSAFDFSATEFHVVFVQDEPPETHIVTVTSTDGGTISPSGAVEVADGGSVSFTIRPDGGYRLDSLEVDGTNVASGVGSYILSDVRADMTVHAVFERSSGPGPTPQPDRYTVTASASEGGSISPSGSTTVYGGGSVTFTMTPDEGHALSRLLVDGEPVTVTGNTYTLRDVRADHTVHAVFEESEPPEPETHTITITSTANGTVTPSGTVEVGDGEDLTLTIIPDDGYRLGSLTVDGTSVASDVGTYTLEHVTSDHTVHAAFVEVPVISHKVTATASEGGSITPSGTITVEEGQDLTFTITADSGYRLSELTVDGSPVEPLDGTYTLESVTSDHTVHAEFERIPAPVTHTVTISHTGNGTVAPTGSVVVGDGEDLTITMAPDKGHHIASVLVDGVPVEAKDGRYTLENITADRTVRVSFEKDGPVTHTVTITASEGGSIDPSGTITVEEGQDLTFTITADSGYRLSALTVDGVPVEAEDGRYTLENITADHAVHAGFERIPAPVTHTVTVTASEGGSISPSGTMTVENGDDISFTITPAEGYRLSQLLVDGRAVTVQDLKYTLSDITGDHTVHAEFVEVLDRIEITSEPVMKVYTAGDTFDPAGMEVTAFYTDGTSRVLDPSEYSYEPSGALTVEHTSVVVTHNGKTDSVDIRVADPDDFDVIVTHYEGTRMENGKKVSFSEDPNVPLNQFTFDTLNITPRTEQTVTMTVSNGTDMDLAAGVFVADPVISEGLRLAEQLTLTVRSGTGTYTASVADIAAGEVLSLGTIDAGGSVTVTVTLEFPESEHNNEAMGQNVSFGLGVIAGQEAASP